MLPDKTINLIQLPSLLALIVITFTVIGLQSSSASPKHYAHTRYISPGITCISCALIETQLLSDHAPSHSTPQCLTPREQQTLYLFVNPYFQLLFFFFFNCGWWSVWSSSTTSLFLSPVFITTLLYPFQPTDLLNMDWRHICIYACVSMWSKRIPGRLGKHFKCILSCTCLWSKHIKPTLLPGEKRSYKDHM